MACAPISRTMSSALYLVAMGAVVLSVACSDKGRNATPAGAVKAEQGDVNYGCGNSNLTLRGVELAAMLGGTDENPIVEIVLKNQSSTSIVVDRELVIPVRLIAIDKSGNRIRWEPAEVARDETTLSRDYWMQRFTCLAPGESIQRSVRLRDGFYNWSVMRGWTGNGSGGDVHGPRVAAELHRRLPETMRKRDIGSIMVEYGESDVSAIAQYTGVTLEESGVFTQWLVARTE